MPSKEEEGEANACFSAAEQVSEIQVNLLGTAIELATGGTAQPHVGTGGGGSTSDLLWRDKEKNSKKKLMAHGSGDWEMDLIIGKDGYGRFLFWPKEKLHIASLRSSLMGRTQKRLQKRLSGSFMPTLSSAKR